MYSLDINFLTDRNLAGDGAAPIEKATSAKSLAPSGQEPAPMIAGGVIAAIALAFSGYLFFGASQAREKTREEIANVDQQIQQANAQNSRITNAEQQIAALKAQSQAFVEVLQTKIKPWSAILEEISDLAPDGLQLYSFGQINNAGAAESADDASATDSAGTADSAGATDNSAVVINGYARDFTVLNDFVLNLQASPLFVGNEVYIIKADLIDNPAILEFSRPVESFDLPKVVEYGVLVTLKDLTDAEIIQTLEEQGARGMAARLKSSF